MSVFQMREWWATLVGEGEEFDRQSLCIGNVDNSKPPSNKIVVGSFQGVVRVYAPKKRQYRMEDLLMEQYLEHSVLQVVCGQFTASKETTLAVLHSRKLSVYRVEPEEEQKVGSGSLHMKLAYENPLDRNAYNMIVGQFGGISKQAICVQSVDGCLYFFEHQRGMLKIVLDDFMLPGPIAYSQQNDSLLLVNSAMEVQCFKFNDLLQHGAAQQAGAAMKHKGYHSQPHITWNLNLGEDVLDIVYHLNQLLKTVDYYILCEHSLHIIEESGKLRYQRRLQFEPLALYVFNNPDNPETEMPNPKEPSSTFIISTNTGHLLIYRSSKLVWTVKAGFIPIYISTSAFEREQGLLLTMADNGWVQVAYLGTTPPQTQLVLPESKDQDYSVMNREHQLLLKKIINRESSEKVEPEDRLVIGVKLLPIRPYNEYVDDQNDELAKDSLNRPLAVEAKLSLSYTGTEAVNIALNVSTPSNIVAQPPQLFIESVKGGTPLYHTVTFFVLKRTLPQTSEVSLNASFFTKLRPNEPRYSSAEFEIPFPLNIKLCLCMEKMKEQTVKYVISSNREPAGLSSIFQDLADMYPEASQNPQVMSFEFQNGIQTTILVSKSGNRYRIQSTHLEGIFFITRELVKRLREIHAPGSPTLMLEQVFLTTKDKLPLEETFKLIEQRFGAKFSLNKLYKTLESESTQFRIIQKKVLQRFKDKNTAPLNNLDLLLAQAYDHVIAKASAIEETQLQISHISQSLCLHIELMLLLASFTFKLEESEYDLLRKHFVLPKLKEEEIGNIGWEEIVDNSVMYLVRNALSKNQRERDQGFQQLKPITEIAKLTKHIASLFDRLSKLEDREKKFQIL